MSSVKIYSSLTGEQLYSAPCDQGMDQGASIGCALIWAIDNSKRICGSDMTGIVIEDQDLSGRNFSCCNLSGCSFINCNLSGCKFDRAIATNGYFSKCNLDGATFVGANLQFTRLESCSTSGLSLKYCNIHKTDFSGSRLDECDIYGTHGVCDYIKNIQIDTYPVSYTYSRVQFGCENLSIGKIKDIDTKKLLELDGRNALRFWRKNKIIINSIVDEYPAKNSIDSSPKRPRRTI